MKKVPIGTAEKWVDVLGHRKGKIMARLGLKKKLGLGNLVDNIIEKIMAQFLDEGSELIEMIIDKIKESNLVDDIIEEVTEAVIEEIVEALTGRDVDIELGDDDDDEEEERVLDMNIKTEDLDDTEFGIE